MSTINFFKCEKANRSEFIEEKSNKDNVNMRNRNLIRIVLPLLLFSIILNVILSFRVCKLKDITEVSKIMERNNQDIVDEKIGNVLDDNINNISDNIDEENEVMQQISFDEQIIVNTSYGNFNLIIEHVKAIDWLENRDEGDEFHAVVIECDVQNINYTDPYNDIFWLENYLNVLDETNYVVDDLKFSKSDGEYIGNAEIPVGANGKILTGYKVKKNVEKLNIIINNQYMLNAEIEL